MQPPQGAGAEAHPNQGRRRGSRPIHPGERVAPMKLSRTVLAAVGGLLIAGPALAQACIRPEERSGLEVRSLQTYLMVSALNCQRTESYNQFVRRFGTEISAANRASSGYFQRAHGGQGRTRFDAHNTNLANEHSEDAIRAGSFFCRDAESLFREALATPGPQLAQYAVQRNIPQSTTAADCAAAGPTAARAARRAVTRTGSRR